MIARHWRGWKGKEARLKEGAEVEVQIEAEKEATTGKA
jgi:hypothetical protein